MNTTETREAQKRVEDAGGKLGQEVCRVHGVGAGRKAVGAMNDARKRFLVALAVIVMTSQFDTLSLAQRKEYSVKHTVAYRTVQIDGLSIFYREAGPKGAPTILLLHGLPSSSRMFEPLLTRLADNYHLVAPDYPGFGHSDWPDPKQFAYTFDHIASVMDDFTQALSLSHYTLYMQDYGGPVGFRMALAHPERVQTLIVQDAVAHNEGLGANWATRRAFWADRPAHEDELRKNLLSLAATRTRHIGDDPNPELYDPDLWTDEYAFLRIAPARRRSRVTCSTTTAPTSTHTPNGKPGCRRCSHSSLSFGVSTICHLIRVSQSAIARMYRMQKYMYLMLVTSHLIPRRTRSQQSCASLY
jgi:pimeloyl-ACP methyl ester carboxylesterase